MIGGGESLPAYLPHLIYRREQRDCSKTDYEVLFTVCNVSLPA